MSEVKKIADKYPKHYVCEKCLWHENIRIEIDHIDNDLDKPLNYLEAFQALDKRLSKKQELPDD